MAHRVVFLDRDGTINVDRGYVSRIEDWELIPGVAEAIRLFHFAGFKVAVVTNQSAVAAGRYALADVERLHAFMQQELAPENARIDAVAICPHAAADRCSCRKPQPGLARQIEQQLGGAIDYAASWAIGDKPSDVGFGHALGTRTVLLQSRYWSPETISCVPSLIADDLRAASNLIWANHRPASNP